MAIPNHRFLYKYMDLIMVRLKILSIFSHNNYDIPNLEYF